MKTSPINDEWATAVICATWDPTESAFEALNQETAKEEVYITVAVDLVIRGIQEPVRFLIETPVKIFGQNERFWYFQRRSLIQQFFLNLKEVGNTVAYFCSFIIISQLESFIFLNVS